ncbi:MAG: hypothetical protein ACJ8DC_04700 [Gemmatimonadales bacterium]
MRPIRLGARAGVLGVTVLLFCGRQPVEGGPRIVARWTGTDSGRIDSPASAEWCDTLGLLEIRALEGDTGMGVAIYPKGALQAGRYRVVRPEAADTSRPAAAVALRWFAETSIRGFKAESGAVVLEQSAPGKYSGRIEAFTKSVTDNAGRVTVRGTLQELTVRPARSGCVPRPPRPDSGAGIH